MALYGIVYVQEHFDELCASMKQFYDTRKKVLKASDLTREADPGLV